MTSSFILLQTPAATRGIDIGKGHRVKMGQRNNAANTGSTGDTYHVVNVPRSRPGDPPCDPPVKPVFV